jgi:hypothetical protein
MEDSLEVLRRDVEARRREMQEHPNWTFRGHLDFFTQLYGRNEFDRRIPYVSWILQRGFLYAVELDRYLVKVGGSKSSPQRILTHRGLLKSYARKDLGRIGIRTIGPNWREEERKFHRQLKAYQQARGKSVRGEYYEISFGEVSRQLRLYLKRENPLCSTQCSKMPSGDAST